MQLLEALHVARANVHLVAAWTFKRHHARGTFEPFNRSNYANDSQSARRRRGVFRRPGHAFGNDQRIFLFRRRWFPQLPGNRDIIFGCDLIAHL